MTRQESQHDEARRWLKVAARDLRVADLLLTEEPSASVFHSQQCAEKSAKAFLTQREVPFRKTHDLTELGNQCAALEPALTPLLRQAADLTEYASVFRYLDAPREPDTPEAEAAVGTARRVYEAIRVLIDGGETPGHHGHHE
ncbi:MAG: HEPN domain-containing protein [Bryobacteraceae bacterium]